MQPLKNQYVAAIDAKLFDACPKAVFAAIAATPAMNDGAVNCGENWSVNEWIVTEWHALATAGVLTQKVPAAFRHLIKRA